MFGLLLEHKYVLYGGAAGSAKSVWLLMCASQHVDQEDCRALILRRTYPELKQLIDESRKMFGDYAKYNQQDHQWTFPSKATITFGHLQHDKNVHQYQSQAYQIICFDEATSFTEEQYEYILTRHRKTSGSEVPLKIRLASNPCLLYTSPSPRD